MRAVAHADADFSRAPDGGGATPRAPRAQTSRIIPMVARCAARSSQLERGTLRFRGAVKNPLTCHELWGNMARDGFAPRGLQRTGDLDKEACPMTKAEIVEDIASKTGLTKKDVATAMDMFLESISKALSEGKHYEIRGFGTFKVKQRKSRMARNPRTGDAVPVPDRKVPVFKVSKELKDLVANA
jgi:nucleoid DNA-binding protein